MSSKLKLNITNKVQITSSPFIAPTEGMVYIYSSSLGSEVKIYLEGEYVANLVGREGKSRGNFSTFIGKGQRIAYTGGDIDKALFVPFN